MCNVLKESNCNNVKTACNNTKCTLLSKLDSVWCAIVPTQLHLLSCLATKVTNTNNKLKFVYFLNFIISPSFSFWTFFTFPVFCRLLAFLACDKTFIAVLFYLQTSYKCFTNLITINISVKSLAPPINQAFARPKPVINCNLKWTMSERTELLIHYNR